MNEIWQASFVVLWVLVVLLAFLLAGALRQLGIIQMRIGDDPGALFTDDGLDRGTPAPDFEALDPQTGHLIRLSDLVPKARVLVFLSTTCGSCREIVPHINETFATRAEEFDFLVICRGLVEECRAFARMNRLKPPLVVDELGQIESSYQVTVTPFTYLLDWEGRVLVRGVANDWLQLDALLDQEGTEEGGRAWATEPTRDMVASERSGV